MIACIFITQLINWYHVFLTNVFDNVDIVLIQQDLPL